MNLWRKGRATAVAAASTGLLFVGVGCGSGGENDVPLPVPATAGEPLSGTLRRSDGQMRAVIEQFLAFNAPPVYTLPPAQARQQPTIADAVRAVLQSQNRSTAPEQVGSVRDTTVPGPAGPLPVRVYTPAGSGPFPVLVYFHGGGWVIGNIEVYDSSCRALANLAGCVVVSVQYRKGPENRFPAAHEDAYAATQYVINNAAQFGGNPARVAVGGESAGGNLAAAVCLLARDRGGRLPVHQMLVYPIAGNDFRTPSYEENADATPLSRPLMQYFFNNYLASPADANNPLIALVNANLRGLPPATVITCEIDPLRSEGQTLAARLQEAGVATRVRDYTGVTHEFFGTGAVVDKARDANRFAAEGLRAAFTP